MTTDKISTTHQLLREAKAKLTAAANWTKGTMARDDDSEPCGYDTPDATMFCALGAVHNAALNTVDDRREERALIANATYALATAAIGRTPENYWRAQKDLASWNDEPDCTHDKVVHAFDAAIANATPKTAR